MSEAETAEAIILKPGNSSHFDEPGWRNVDVERVLAELEEKGLDLAEALEVGREAIELLKGRVADSPAETGVKPAQREHRVQEAWWIPEDAVR